MPAFAVRVVQDQVKDDYRAQALPVSLLKMEVMIVGIILDIVLERAWP